MFRTLAPAMAAFIALSSFVPAFADSSAKTDSCVKGAMMIPVKFVAFTTGAVVGTPIAVVRKVCQNTTIMSGEASKNSTNPLLRVTTAACIFPMAAFKGSIEGSVLGTENSWKNSSEKPFSADSFSLGELKSE